MKTYRVHGYCMVPCEAEILIDATDANDALLKALTAWNKDKQPLIVGSSVDEGAAYDWQPTAELVPNAEVRRPRRPETK